MTFREIWKEARGSGSLCSLQAGDLGAGGPKPGLTVVFPDGNGVLQDEVGDRASKFRVPLNDGGQLAKMLDSGQFFRADRPGPAVPKDALTHSSSELGLEEGTCRWDTRSALETPGCNKKHLASEQLSPPSFPVTFRADARGLRAGLATPSRRG